MSFIDSLLSMLEGMEQKNISVHEERCVCIRNRNAKCLKCVEVCTTGAIAYEANDLQVYPEKCIGCGTCANVCPTSALEVVGLSDDELTRAVKQSIRVTKGHPVITCQTALDAAKELLEKEAPERRGLLGASKQAQAGFDENALCVVPCLGRIDESLLIGIAAYKSFDATLVCGNCETCAHAKGGDFVRKVAPDAHRMIAAFGKEMPIYFTSEYPERVKLAPGEDMSHISEKDLPGMSRREAFKEVKDAGVELAQSGVDSLLGEEKPEPVPVAYRKVNPHTGTLSHFVPTRRTRMYNYLRHIGEPVAKEVETRVVGKMHIDTEKCTSCRMCAVFCPTGAIMKVDEEGTFGIFHRPAACVQCRLCESLCRPQAITIESTMSIDEFMGKKGVLYEMPRPEWTPNKPDSMFNKIHHVLGDDLPMRAF